VISDLKRAVRGFRRAVTVDEEIDAFIRDLDENGYFDGRWEDESLYEASALRGAKPVPLSKIDWYVKDSDNFHEPFKKVARLKTDKHANIYGFRAVFGVKSDEGKTYYYTVESIGIDGRFSLVFAQTEQKPTGGYHGGTYALTSTMGNASGKVLATVVLIMNQFIKVVDPVSISFTSSEASRTRLYKTLARTFGKGLFDVNVNLYDMMKRKFKTKVSPESIATADPVPGQDDASPTPSRGSLGELRKATVTMPIPASLVGVAVALGTRLNVTSERNRHYVSLADGSNGRWLTPADFRAVERYITYDPEPPKPARDETILTGAGKWVQGEIVASMPGTRFYREDAIQIRQRPGGHIDIRHSGSQDTPKTITFADAERYVRVVRTGSKEEPKSGSFSVTRKAAKSEIKPLLSLADVDDKHPIIFLRSRSGAVWVVSVTGVSKNSPLLQEGGAIYARMRNLQMMIRDAKKRYAEALEKASPAHIARAQAHPMFAFEQIKLATVGWGKKELQNKMATKPPVVIEMNATAVMDWLARVAAGNHMAPFS